MASLHSLDGRLLLAACTRGHGRRRERTMLPDSRPGEHPAWWPALAVGGAAAGARLGTPVGLMAAGGEAACR